MSRLYHCPEFRYGLESRKISPFCYWSVSWVTWRSWQLADFPNSWLTHYFILKEETPPKCPCRNQYSIKNILIECTKLNHTRKKFYKANSMKELFFKNCSQKHNQHFKTDWPPIKDIDYYTNTFDHQIYTNKMLWHLYIHTHINLYRLFNARAFLHMCLWRNGYRHRKWTQRHKFKSWTRKIAFHIALILLGKVWIQLFSLQLWVNSRTD